MCPLLSQIVNMIISLLPALLQSHRLLLLQYLTQVLDPQGIAVSLIAMVVVITIQASLFLERMMLLGIGALGGHKMLGHRTARQKVVNNILCSKVGLNSDNYPSQTFSVHFMLLSSFDKGFQLYQTFV